MIDFGLTGMEWKLLRLLVTGSHPSKPAMMAELYDDKYAYEPPDKKILDVMVCKMRKKLKPYGITLSTHWGRGYYLTPADKDIVILHMRETAQRITREEFDGVDETTTYAHIIHRK